MNPVALLLPVLIPVVGGLMIIFIGFKSDFARAVYCEAVALAATASVWLCILGLRGKMLPVISYASGFSVILSVDGLGALFAGMISLMWPLVLVYAFSYMREAERKNRFFAFFVMTYGVTVGIAFAANMTTMYVFYEMLTLVTIPLVTHYGDHDSMFAGRKYAAYTIGGAALAFFTAVLTTLSGGGVFHYGGSIGGNYDASLLRLAFLFGFIGFGTKAAVFPVHDWLPTASVAPTPVTALLHAVAVVNAGVFCLMRVCYYVYGPDLLKGTAEQKICLALSIVSLLAGAVMAIRERHIKRRMAFSTMSNLSYMLFGIMLLSPAGLAAGASHMVFHGLTKMTLFMCAGAFMHVTGKSNIYEINGAGRKMPVTFICYTLGACSLTGFPLFACFISKWQLLTAGAMDGTPLGIAGCGALIAAAFLCAIYTLTISFRAFFSGKAMDRFAGSALGDADLCMLIPIAVFTASMVILGVRPGWIMSLINSIAGGAL
ncbi:MAG: proton-conducting transporter membrane subunit [Lachnospiraceae bacterium]|nr:proton-conducting transporter membrane subunit [Lachnospiraceae bacterium]